MSTTSPTPSPACSTRPRSRRRRVGADRGCTTCDIPSPSPRCWSSTATAAMSRPGCRCSRPGSATSTRSRRTGICRPSRNCSPWRRGPSRGRVRGAVMSALAPILQAFFTDRLIRQRQASANTVAAYRDACRLLLEFANRATGLAPNKLDLADLDAGLVTAFLQHLETERANIVTTRNTRLAAIHSLFRYAALRAPEHADQIGRVLSIDPVA